MGQRGRPGLDRILECRHSESSGIGEGWCGRTCRVARAMEANAECILEFRRSAERRDWQSSHGSSASFGHAVETERIRLTPTVGDNGLCSWVSMKGRRQTPTELNSTLRPEGSRREKSRCLGCETNEMPMQVRRASRVGLEVRTPRPRISDLSGERQPSPFALPQQRRFVAVPGLSERSRVDVPRRVAQQP